jgi:hypothetical protein
MSASRRGNLRNYCRGRALIKQKWGLFHGIARGDTASGHGDRCRHVLGLDPLASSPRVLRYVDEKLKAEGSGILT